MYDLFLRCAVADGRITKAKIRNQIGAGLRAKLVYFGFGFFCGGISVILFLI